MLAEPALDEVATETAGGQLRQAILGKAVAVQAETAKALSVLVLWICLGAGPPPAFEEGSDRRGHVRVEILGDLVDAVLDIRRA